MLVYLIVTPKVLTSPIKIDDPITFTIYDIQMKNNEFQTKPYTNQTLHIVYDMIKPEQITDKNDLTFMGYKLYVGFLQDLTHANIYMNARFSDKFIDLTNIQRIQLQAVKISQKFTLFSILIRYVFFILAIIMLSFYLKGYSKIPQFRRTVEQRLIFVLSIALLFFNDPLYPITILKQNMFNSFLSILFVITFLNCLMFSWVIFFQRILYQQGQRNSKKITKLKIGFFIVLQILMLVLYMLIASFRLNQHPLVGEQDLTTNKYLTLQIIIFIMFCIVFVYILFLYVKNLLKMQQLQSRSKLFMIYSWVFVISFFTFFEADRSFGPYYYNGVIIMVLYGFLNFYIWYLQFMYTVSQQGNQDINQRKINENDQVATIQFNDISINLDHDQRCNKDYQKIQYKQKQYNQNINHQQQNHMKNNHLDKNNFIQKIQQNNKFGYSSNSVIQLRQDIRNKNQNKHQQKQVDFFNQDETQKQYNIQENQKDNKNNNKKKQKQNNTNTNNFNYDNHNDSIFSDDEDDDEDNQHKKSNDFGSFQMQ